MAQTGNSATLTIGSFTATYSSIGGSTFTREAHDVTAVNSTNFKEYIAGSLQEPGDFEAEFYYDSSAQPPIADATGTVTVTFPLKSGQSTAATLAGTAFVNSWSSPELTADGVMMSRMTVKWDGVTEPTFTAGS